MENKKILKTILIKKKIAFSVFDTMFCNFCGEELDSEYKCNCDSFKDVHRCIDELSIITKSIDQEIIELDNKRKSLVKGCEDFIDSMVMSDEKRTESANKYVDRINSILNKATN